MVSWRTARGARLTRVSGHAERLAALEMIERHADRPRAITLGADRGYDAADFVEELRTLNIRSHVAQNVSRRRSAIDRRTTRHAGYAASLRARKRIEEAFGWIKTVAGLRRTKLRGLDRVDWSFTFAAAYVDDAGVLTIGWGHTGPGAKAGRTCTAEEGEALLAAELSTFETHVDRLTKAAAKDTTQGQFDAMELLAFNIGKDGFARSTGL
jgi:hypothetical protein